MDTRCDLDSRSDLDSWRYTVRPVAPTDAAAIADLILAAEQVSFPDVPRYQESDIRADWHGLDLQLDTWLVVTPDGQPCGYATLTFVADAGRFFGDGYTHRDHLGRGIGRCLLDRMRARAAATLPPGDTRVVLTNHTYLGDQAQRLLEKNGYQLVRVFHEMRIDLDPDPPVRPAWPTTVAVRACVGSPAEIHAAYECIEDAFTDHWGRVRRSYDQWSARMTAGPFDASLWYFAEAAGEVVGAALCRVRDGHGHVDQLGVVRAWRRRGIGEALLRHTFAELHARGVRRVELGVDSASLTGADRLYQRAGMQVVARTGRFEIELRPGRDLLAAGATG